MTTDIKGFFNESSSAETVNARMSCDISPRLLEVMSALVDHIHAFTKSVRLTQQEWEFAIEFLTKTGQICTQERQEFILLSDTLGLSMLVDAINNQRPEGATENTVLGPFHVKGAPELAMGSTISLDGKGELCLFQGAIKNSEGYPIANATIDVWSDNSDGYYDVQQPDSQPKWNNRGVFRTGTDGAYRFIGIKPVSYPIPDDGPVGKMLEALGRHPYRPAHMHFIVTAPGYQKLVTHTFLEDDRFINSDAVFGVKTSLIAAYEKLDNESARWRSHFDFILVPDERETLGCSDDLAI